MKLLILSISTVIVVIAYLLFAFMNMQTHGTGRAGLLSSNSFRVAFDTTYLADNGFRHGTLDFDESLDKRFDLITQNIRQQSGTYSVYIMHFESGQTFEYNADQTYYAASLYKVPVAIATMKAVQEGMLSTDTKLTYSSQHYFGGSGILSQDQHGSEYTVYELLSLLLKYSDNSAQSVLLSSIPQTLLQQSFSEYVPSQSTFFSENTTSAKEQAIIFENLLKSRFLTEMSIHTILDLMSETQFDDRISQGIGSDAVFSHKIGNWPETSSWHDCGLLQSNSNHFTVCVMSQGVNYETFLETSTQVGSFVYELSLTL